MPRLVLYHNPRWGKSRGAVSLLQEKKIDYTMCSISGLSGLEPILKIIKLSKKIAIANKESLICGWNLIKRKLA